MSYPITITAVEDAAEALRHIPDADDRRTLLRILCGSRFEPLEGGVEPTIDWDSQPPWAVYAAMDEDGGWWTYSADVYPDRRDGTWTTHAEGVEVERMADPPDEWVGDWRESRRVRPGTTAFDRERH